MIDLTCAHHEHHETRTVHVSLGGQPAVPDYPPIPDRLALEFDLDIWDADRYDNTEGYCTGDDMVSRSIAQQGIWEGFETLLVLDILNRYEGTVVDIGCQLGWYSTIAAATGHDVVAMDGDVQCGVLTSQNLGRYPDVTWEVSSQKFEESDPVSLRISGPIGDYILLLKADIEGQELAALRAFSRRFEAHEIPFAIVEVTPVWGLNASAAVIKQMVDWGYLPYVIPDKGYGRMAEFVADPLGETIGQCRMGVGWLAFVDQVNVLFARTA